MFQFKNNLSDESTEPFMVSGKNIFSELCLVLTKTNIIIYIYFSKNNQLCSGLQEMWKICGSRVCRNNKQRKVKRNLSYPSKVSACIQTSHLTSSCFGEEALYSTTDTIPALLSLLRLQCNLFPVWPSLCSWALWRTEQEIATLYSLTRPKYCTCINSCQHLFIQMF